MPEKRSPLGVCDLCGVPFPSGVPLYTTRGSPRLYCSDTCKATANSRAGAPIRSRKAKERIRRGEWQNPLGDTPEQVAEALRARNVSSKQRRKVSAARKREVGEGRWRNPAHDPDASAKLSRPRVHVDNPILHSAISRLSAGDRMSDLTDQEARLFREYRRALRDRRRGQVRKWYRERYRRQMSTEEGRAEARRKWERQRERERTRAPNHALRQARLEAGYSQAGLASALGVTQSAISKWERISARPDKEMQRRTAELLGVTVDEIFGR